MLIFTTILYHRKRGLSRAKVKFLCPKEALFFPLSRFTIGAVFIIMENMDNLVLIGMPSSGKSTAGVLLAKRIGYGFIDCDLIIQGEEGKKLSRDHRRQGR